MTTLPIGPWTVAHGESEGRPLFLRLNTGAAAVARHATLAHRVGIAVLLREPDASGLPSAHEATVLERIEGAIEGSFRVGHEAVLAIVLTTAGMREFVLYSAAPQNMQAAVAVAQARFPEYQIQSYMQPDTEWDGYAAFADSLLPKAP
jgi:hypothetical protein